MRHSKEEIAMLFFKFPVPLFRIIQDIRREDLLCIYESLFRNLSCQDIHL